MRITAPDIHRCDVPDGMPVQHKSANDYTGISRDHSPKMNIPGRMYPPEIGQKFLCMVVTPLSTVPDRLHTHAQLNVIVDYPRKRIHTEV